MKFFNKIMLIVAAAATMVACQKEETFAPSKSVKLTVNAEAEALQNDTRTYIDNTNTILWGAEESMTVSCYDVAAASSHFATATTTEYADQSKASFTFEFTGLNAESTNFVLGGVYPTAACIDSDKVNSFKVSLPAKQSATANSYDPAAYIMVAQPVEVSTLPESLMMTYRRATALNKVTLTGIDDDIVSVTITAPEDVVLAGRRYFDLTEGTANEIYYGQTNEITVSYNEALVGGYDMDVWFTSWESSIAEGAELTICAKSETTSYTRTITANANGISFKEGYLNLLKVNMATDDVVTEALTDYSGTYVAAVKYNGTYYAISVEANGKRQAAVALNSWDVANGICYTNNANIVWEIAKTESGYTMLNDTKYMYYGGSGNYASTSTDPYYLTIEDNSAVAAGTVKIGSKNLPERILQYNSSSNYFAFYTSNQVSAVYLLNPVADNRIALTTPTVTATANGESEINVSWNTIENAGHYVVTCGDKSQTISDATSCSFTGLVHSTNYDISVIAIPSDLATYTASSAGTATATTDTPAEVFYYVPVTAVTAGKKYLIVANNSGVYCAATPVASNKSYDYLQKTEVTVTEQGIISTAEVDALAFTINASATEGYNIIDSNSKYIYQTGSYANFNVSATLPANGADWTISIDANGLATITNTYVSKVMQYSTSYNNFAIYASVTGVLPQLYMLQE